MPGDGRHWGRHGQCREPALQGRYATSVHLPEAAYEALRQVAFDERLKIHDLLMEGVELALKKRGYPALAEMKAKGQRKER
jgi:hypothetical protein